MGAPCLKILPTGSRKWTFSEQVDNMDVKPTTYLSYITYSLLLIISCDSLS